MTALSIVPAARCRSSRRPDRGRRRACACRAAAAGRAPARTSRVSRGSTVARSEPGARARPEAPRATSRAASAISSSSAHAAPARRRRSRPATGATRRRRTTKRLSKTHCISRPGSPTNDSSITRRSYQRFTVTIGIDVHRAAAAERSRERAAAARRRRAGVRCEPRHGGDHRGACDRGRRGCRPPRTASVLDDDARQRVDRTSPPRASMKARAGSAYIWCSGRVGSTSASAAGSGPNISASTRTNGAAAASSGDWFSAATASGSHSHARSCLPLAVRREPMRNGSVRLRRSRAGALQLAPRAPQRSGAVRSDRQAIAPRHRVPVEHAGQQVQRRRQRRAPQHRSASARDRCRAPTATAAPGRCPRRRSGAGTRTSRDSSRTARAGRCPRARRSRDRVNAVARPPSCGRASRTSTVRPASASAAAALSPAKPPPMTTTSASAVTGRTRRCAPRWGGDQRALAAAERARPTEHVVVAPLDAVENARDRWPP